MIRFGKEKEHVQISRTAAVLVEAPGSEGSGAIFTLNDITILISAAHVTGSTGTKGSIIQGDETYFFEVFYAHRYTDVSFAVVKGHPQTNLTEYDSVEPSSIGETMVYSGFPDSFNKTSFIGVLVGGEMLNYNPRYVLNVYSWFGASGAIAFNQNGEPIGVNSSIANLENRYSNETEAMPTIAFFSPLYSYTRPKVVEYLCEYGIESESCTP